MQQNVTLQQMLEAREERAQRQHDILAQHHLPLVSYSMNIAGPVKNSEMIRRGFRVGKRMLEGLLPLFHARIVAAEEIDTVTGCEGIYAIDGIGSQKLKELTCRIEDETSHGRLFDMDVITTDGEKLDRPEDRKCLICDKPAKFCARTRIHSMAELQTATEMLLKKSLDEEDARTAAGLAVRALLYEVCVTPKPGLVDRRHNGSHRDMDIYSFMASASTLWPYFADCVRIGQATAGSPAPETFSALRFSGMMAECGMRQATGGVNTHRGAIFSMGVLCGALGRLSRDQWQSPDTILKEVAAMTAESVRQELDGVTSETAHTAGQRIYAAYRVPGVRGEAGAGFPSVLHNGLPLLESCLKQGLSNDETGSIVLLHLIADTTDTNLIARGGYELQQNIVDRLRTLLDQQPIPDRETIYALDQEFLSKNLSPGGSADLLALCWMLHFLKEEPA